MESALAIAEAGYDVALVEKESQLGGHGREVRKTWQGQDVQEYLNQLTASVQDHERISVMLNTQVKRNRGVQGSFVTTLSQNGKTVDLSHGVTLLATGGQAAPTEEYLHGRHKDVYTWSELSRKMLEDPSAFDGVNTAVFIQCVGSREPQRPHCSKICCSFALRTALDLKSKNPHMDIFILYREMRAFGEREDIYREARQKGIAFIRYDLDHKPLVETARDGVTLSVYEPVLQKTIALQADLISLQTAIVPSNNGEMAEIFQVPLDPDGFFADSPQKLKPLDAAVEGVYLAGLALYPKDTTESIAQARGAAARAMEILSRDTVEVGGVIAEVMPERCAVCCTCVRTCPFGVPVVDPEIGAAFIDPGLCQGCGMCVAECPNKAIVMPNCSDEMLIGMPSILLRQGTSKM
jgi:heterodisulfide reductase subunit A